MAVHILRVIGVTSCFFSGCLALTDSEWRVAIVDVYRRATEYINLAQYERIRDLFSEDAEGLVPEGPVTGKSDIVSAIENFPKEIVRYFGFVELLYNTPDEAVAWHVGYGKTLNGTTNKYDGFSLFVLEKGNVKFKLNIHNSV